MEDRHLNFYELWDNPKTSTNYGTTPKGHVDHLYIRPYQPQQNGKVERFNRTLLDEWAYARVYTSNPERTTALTPSI